MIQHTFHVHNQQCCSRRCFRIFVRLFCVGFRLLNTRFVNINSILFLYKIGITSNVGVFLYHLIAQYIRYIYNVEVVPSLHH